MSPFFRLLVGHLVGDFVLQTIELVRYKASSWKGLLLHTGIVSASTALFLWSDLPEWWPWLLFLTLLHFLTDWGKVALTRRFPQPVLSLFLLDQSLHVGAIVGAVVLAGRGWPYPSVATAIGGTTSQANRSLLFLPALLIVIFVAPLLEMLVAQTATRSAPSGQSDGNSVKASVADRVWGGGERVVALGLIYLGGIATWFSPLAFLPRIVAQRPSPKGSRSAEAFWAKVGTSVGCVVLLGALLMLLDTRL